MDGELQIGTDALLSGLIKIMSVVTELERDHATAAYGETLRNACDLITDGVMIELGSKERELEELRESLRRTHRVPGFRRTNDES